MLQEILNYTRSVIIGTFICTLDICPYCKIKPDGFTLHDTRKRLFSCKHEGLIKTVKSFITRWQCPLCGKKTTVYPEFAVPYKRYVTEIILEKCNKYLEDDLPEKEKPVTYVKAVQNNNMPIFYHNEETEPPNYRSLAPSTVHRWLSTLSSFSETVRRALQLIKQKSSTSTIFRKILPVASRKYRSIKRKNALQNVRKLLHVNHEYRNLFTSSIFPNLATVCQWE